MKLGIIGGRCTPHHLHLLLLLQERERERERPVGYILGNTAANTIAFLLIKFYSSKDISAWICF